MVLLVRGGKPNITTEVLLANLDVHWGRAMLSEICTWEIFVQIGDSHPDTDEWLWEAMSGRPDWRWNGPADQRRESHPEVVEEAQDHAVLRPSPAREPPADVVGV